MGDISSSKKLTNNMIKQVKKCYYTSTIMENRHNGMPVQTGVAVRVHCFKDFPRMQTFGNITFQYIPIKQLPKLLLENSLTCSRSQQTRKIVLYIDDFEVSNPLCPEATLHKLEVVTSPLQTFYQLKYYILLLLDNRFELKHVKVITHKKNATKKLFGSESISLQITLSFSKMCYKQGCKLTSRKKPEKVCESGLK